MRELLIVRHGHALSNVGDVVSGLPPGEGLSEQGVEEALALRDALAGEEIAIAFSSELERARQTLELALGGRDVPRLVLADLNEIRFGAFEGGPLEAYRAWAWTSEPAALCPGGGETRLDAALRVARALDGAEGAFPTARITPVSHATAAVLTAEAVARAAATLRAWRDAPRFRDGSPEGA